MGNGAIGNVVQGGAGIVRPSPKSPWCKAWREEAKAWCDSDAKRKGEKKNRNFNKRFYENLNGKLKDLPKRLDPEQPIGLLMKGDEAKNLVSTFNDIAASGAPGAGNVAKILGGWSALAPRIWGIGKYITGKSMCSSLNRRISSVFGSQFTGLHADGVLRPSGTTVEIKGPGDSEQANQYDNMKKCSPNGKVLLVDHKACDPGGEITTPGGNCKKKS